MVYAAAKNKNINELAFSPKNICHLLVRNFQKFTKEI
jgi:hypothetical protein